MQKVNIKTNDEITSSEKISYQEIKTKNNSKISVTNFFFERNNIHIIFWIINFKLAIFNLAI